MRQKKISYWLKGLVIALALLGIGFLGGFMVLTVFYRQMLDVEVPVDMVYVRNWGMVIYAVFFYFAILAEFWKVCTEIGRDNSFSLENAKSFRRMSIFAGIEAVGFMIRVVFGAAFGLTGIFEIVFRLAEIFVSVVFLILCEALSQLIRNAYEMKQENDLTI